jgi:hypothetical protein
MLVPSLWGELQDADAALCKAIDTTRRLAQDGTWQDCAETSEVEALEYLVELLKLRDGLLGLQRRANK